MKTKFGWVEIGDKRYEKDVIVHVDGRVSKRHKKLSKGLKAKYGHTPLSEKELDFLAKEKPEVVFVGTGHEGSLPITPLAEKILDHYASIIDKTPAALETMSRETRPFVAIIHVTC